MPSPRRIAWLLFAASLALRAGVAAELWDTPLSIHHEWEETDNHFFVESAQRLAAGDWLGATPEHPFHGWHALLAKRHARATGVPYNDAWAQALWTQWYGGARYHQEPLYTWLLGAVLTVAPDVRWALLLQLLAGAAGTSLVFLVALRLCRRLGTEPSSGLALRLAVGAALAHLAYGPLAYYDLVLHRTSLQCSLGLLVAWATLRALDQPLVAGRAALLGALLAASVLLVSTGLPFALLVLVVVGARARYQSSRRALYALLATFLLGLAPAVGRNLAVGVAPLELSSVGAITFINANAADVDPAGGFMVSRYAHTIMAKSQGQLGEAVRLTLSTHEGMGWLQLLVGKLRVMFDPVEVPNNESYAYYASWSRLLGVSAGFAPYALLLVLALVGALPRWRATWPVLVPLVVGVGVTLVFYNLSRFRAPLVALGLPLAPVGVLVVRAWVKERRWPALAATAAAALALMTLRLQDGVPPSAVRPVDVTIGSDLWHRMANGAGQGAGEVMERAALEGPEVANWLTSESRWRPADRRDVVAATMSLYGRGAALASDPTPYREAADALVAALNAR